MTHKYKICCQKCGDITEATNTGNMPMNVATVIKGSCKVCVPDSIMTSYIWLDSENNRVGQDAAKINPAHLMDAATKIQEE